MLMVHTRHLFTHTQNIFFWNYCISNNVLLHKIFNVAKAYEPPGTVKNVGDVSGAFMMLRKEIFKDTGGFDPDFFLYYEEFDWCNQIKKKGYKVYYQPKSLIYHKESMTTGKSSPLKTFYITRNRILFMRRNAPLPGLFVFLVYFTCFTIPKNTLQFLLKKQKDHLRSFWKGILWHFNSKITFN